MLALDGCYSFFHSVDGASFGHAHLGAVDEWRDIERIGIAIANESLRYRFENDCFEDPTGESWVTAHKPVYEDLFCPSQCKRP